MRATARVDRTLCCGAGSCEVMGPRLFRIAEDGLSEFLPSAVGGKDLLLLQDIARCCPTGAIRVADDGERTAEKGRGMGQYTDQAVQDPELVIGRLWERNYDPGTRNIIENLRLSPDARCLDVGAGLGSMSRWLDERVPEGSVLAVDTDISRLGDTASARVSVRHEDITTADFAEASFDLILMRAVLSYLPDAAALLAKAARWLARGGWLVAEEFYFLPSEDGPNAVGRRVVDGYMKAAAGAGVDWQLARRLPSLLAKTGLGAVGRTVRPLGPGQGEQENELMRARMELQGGALVDNGLVTAEDIADFLDTLDDPASQDVTTLLFSVWGQR
jgi:SAM-dependent methyltransferase